MFIINVVTDEMVSVAIAWGFLSRKNKYIYEHGVFVPIRKKLQEIQDVYVAKAVDANGSIDDDDKLEEDDDGGMVLAPITEEKIVVCDFEKAIVIAVK